MDAININVQPGHTITVKLPEELWAAWPEGQAVQVVIDEHGRLIVTPLDAEDEAELPGLRQMFEEALAEEDEVLPYHEAMAEIDRKRGRSMA